jgi:hypothetical protein
LFALGAAGCVVPLLRFSASRGFARMNMAHGLRKRSFSVLGFIKTIILRVWFSA